MKYFLKVVTKELFFRIVKKILLKLQSV